MLLGSVMGRLDRLKQEHIDKRVHFPWVATGIWEPRRKASAGPSEGHFVSQCDKEEAGGAGRMGRGDSGKDVCVPAQSFSCVWLCDPWTVACQAPLSMESSRQEYWSGLPFPTPGDLPDLGIEPVSLEAPALAGGFFTTEPPGYRSEKGHKKRLSQDFHTATLCLLLMITIKNTPKFIKLY